MTPDHRARITKELAAQVGFDQCGVAPAEPIGRADYARWWLQSPRAGTMNYLRRDPAARTDPRQTLEGARSVIIVAQNYKPPIDDPDQPVHGEGRIARYARGEDYHVVLKDRLFELMQLLTQRLDAPFSFRVFVDTGPIIERELAAAAGIGWIGKNTLVLNPILGSYLFLGAAITDLPIAWDDPLPDHCGSCTACLEACPTSAFPAPYEMNASRCISYLTIEHRGQINPELARGLGDRLFGCDICQEVCPFNRKSPSGTDSRLLEPRVPPALPVAAVLNWTEEDYRRQLRGTALKRAKLASWTRNARIVSQNDHPPPELSPGAT